MKFDKSKIFTAVNADELVEEPKEKKYRPYKTCEEMIKDYKARFETNTPLYSIPLIWVEGKTTHRKVLIFGFDEDRVNLDNLTGNAHFEDLFCSYTYLDGSPCGVEL